MKKLFSVALALGVTLAFIAQAQALTCYAITQGNRLLTFDSSTPGTVTSDVAISGINAAYSVVGIDIRTTTQTVGAANPGVGSLWGIAFNSTNYFLCVINSATAVATQIGGILTLDSGANPDVISFGFDPSADRFRFISVEKNFQIDPNTVSAVQQTSFPGFPAHSGAAFTTASYKGSIGRFYNISRQVDPRVLQTSANIATGAVTVVGPGTIGSGINAPLGLAISGSLFLMAAEGKLYTIDRNTGSANSGTAIMGGPTIRGLAIKPTSFPPALSVTVKIKGKKKIATTATSLKIKGTASSAAGITLVKYKIGKGKFKTAKGTTNWNFKAKLKLGLNKITVVATGGNAIQSAPATIKVKRIE